MPFIYINKSDATRPFKQVRETVKAHYRDAARRGSVKFNSHSNHTKKAYAEINDGKRKNLPKYNKPDDTENVEVSIRHLLDGTPQQKLKKICFNGSDKKIGMSWTQFRDEGRGACEVSKSISKHLPDLYFSMIEDFKVRATYFLFNSVVDAAS
ncbi:hypothetical protein AYI68_g8326 [Smittium mucronatum]|uniref:Uncharacterized protein n=1 Tax=Smittium mucronatum TaxID=133383 RepID=A0A1R0GL72_9FUNG|nr:hypothetical protein AYI68_g8326 [Smittium mucronatum]